MKTNVIAIAFAACIAAEGVHGSTPHTLDAANLIHQVFAEIQTIGGADPDSPIAGTLEDAADSIAVALIELNESPPDLRAALGRLEAAVGDLEAALGAGLEPSVVIGLMTALADAGRHLVQMTLDAAIAGDGYTAETAEAEYLLAQGDAFRDAGAYKDAVSRYRDALARSASAPG